MRTRVKRNSLPAELSMAIGLIWGFLRADQFEDAYRLARGCLRVWPDDERLGLMAAYAAAEVLEPIDDAMQAALAATACREWAEVVLRRAAINAAPPQPQ